MVIGDKERTIFTVIALSILFLGSHLLGEVAIIIQERDGYARKSEPVTLGVPFVKGTLSTSSPKRIINPSGSAIPAQFKTMALWSDGSIKWLKCDFQVKVNANSTATYLLKTDLQGPGNSELSVMETASAITVTTGPIRFKVNKSSFNLLDEVLLDLDGNRSYAASEAIISPGQSPGPAVTVGGTNYHASAKVPETISIEEQGPMKVVIKVSGRHYNGSSYRLKYETRIYAYAGKSFIRLWHVYANGKSVDSLSYPLDPTNGASFDRYGLDFKLNLEGSKTARLGGESNQVVLTSLSGGEAVSLLQKDIAGPDEALYYSISRGNNVLATGTEAAGWGTLTDATWGMTVSSRYFWQKYPKGLVLKENGMVSIEPAPSLEYLYVGMGTGDEILLYFHSAAAASTAGQTAVALNHAPLLARASAQQYENSRVFYELKAGQAPYANMASYIDEVTDNHLLNRAALGLYGNINFGDTPAGYWYVDGSDLDGSGWGNNYYDCNVLTPIRLFVQEGDLRYSDIFIPGARFFMETACWNPYNTGNWLAGYCPSYSSYHRGSSHFEHHYGEGIWYYYYLTGDERAREVGMRAANAIKNEQWWGNENVNCRMAYQRGSTCIEAWKVTRNAAYLNHAKHLLVTKILDTQDKYGLIGSTTETNTVDGEQVFMIALYSDTLWKYIQELSPGSSERKSLTAKLAKLADFIDTYARKSPGIEAYWNFFDAPSNNHPPQAEKDDQNPDATVYWFGKGLIAGTYAYAYHLTGQAKYKTLASNLIANLWTPGVIDWEDSEFWSKPSGQAMKNLLHAVTIINQSAASGITLTSPNGGETLLIGSSYPITWASTGSVGAVKIEWSSNNGGTWSTVSATTANSGSFLWLVSALPSTECLIRIIEVGGSVFDISDASFTIANQSSGGTISVDRERLNFCGVLSGSVSGPQELSITTDSNALSWTISDDASWLTSSQVSGMGSKSILITANPSGLVVGNYMAVITVVSAGATNSPWTVKVYFNIKPASQNQAPFGLFETPSDGDRVEGSIAVTGWVLDDVAVASVKVYNGSAYVGDAVFVAGARPDVAQAYPAYPFNYKAGWGYMLLTNFLPNQGNGIYTIKAIATDVSGKQVTLGSKVIHCDNANATRPFGAIDTPTQGGTASGASFINWGWALTPMPASIRTDGSTIRVWLDGEPKGNPVYNLPRSDIQSLFPGYANTNGAVGYYYIDTTQLANGIHTIAWSVTDSNNITEGVGSRYFRIQNTGSSRHKGMGKIRNVLPVRGVVNERTRSTARIRLKQGFSNRSASQELEADQKGIFHVTLNELDRMELKLGAASNIKAGYLLLHDGLHGLPVGSTLDKDNSIFYWLPGPAFKGCYNFVFFTGSRQGKSIGSGFKRKVIQVNVEINGENKKGL
jgi:PcRGLX-like protein central beta sandwich domain/PcRGLX-like N-terminal RIFT barrel domain